MHSCIYWMHGVFTHIGCMTYPGSNEMHDVFMLALDAWYIHAYASVQTATRSRKADQAGPISCISMHAYIGCMIYSRTYWMHDTFMLRFDAWYIHAYIGCMIYLCLDQLHDAFMHALNAWSIHCIHAYIGRMTHSCLVQVHDAFMQPLDARYMHA